MRFSTSKGDSFSTIVLSRELSELFDSYENFKERTRKGLNGMTAKYWSQYIDFVTLYHQFSRSTREGDFELYVYTLQMITNLFFSFNQPNYSRWAVRVHDNLLKLKMTHPSLAEEFQNRRIGIRRMSKEFSGMPIDLTLENKQ